MLQEFVTLNRADIIGRCRVKAAARSVLPATDADVSHGVPLFLDQLVEVLRTGLKSNPEIAQGALLHGRTLLRQGLTLAQVVHSYGDVCQSITDLAVETSAPIGAGEFGTLNRCLDDAIAGAVTEFGREGSGTTVDGALVQEGERLGFFAHEANNLINTGMIAFDILKTGNVGVGGSTGAVLGRSLLGLRALVKRSLAQVTLTEGIQHPERLVLEQFIGALAPAAMLESAARGVTLLITPIQGDLTVLADRTVLAAVVGNVLQNAFTFTAPASTVTLRVGATTGRVFIEIEDACGGLPAGDVNDLFRPFEQRGADRTGVGLGLAFCRWAVEASSGHIYARNRPDVGCVFTIDLPRVTDSALALASVAAH